MQVMQSKKEKWPIIWKLSQEIARPKSIMIDTGGYGVRLDSNISLKK